MTKEKLVQDILDKGDRAKHLNRLIEIMERMKIAYFREIVCWLLNIFEKSVKFSPEALRYLHQEIIEGHQEGNSSPLVLILWFKNLVVTMRTVAFWLGQLPGPLDNYVYCR